MKKFMVLYMASGPEFEKMKQSSTPDRQKEGMEAWKKWMNDNKASIVEGGAPLGKTKRVDSNGGSDTKNEVGGYSVLQANRMRRPRSYSAKTIHFCECPAHG